MDVGDLRHESFSPLVGDTFRARHSTGLVDLFLAKAERVERPDQADESFSIVFQGPPDPFLPQAIYELEHQALGTVGIFLVPIGEESNGFLYEAVFTRLP